MTFNLIAVLATDLLGFVCSVIDGGGRRAWRLAFDVLVVVFPVLIWSGHVTVPSVGCRPVELISKLYRWCVVRTLKEVQNPHLKKAYKLFFHRCFLFEKKDTEKVIT
jgi:hypothetical protein